MTDQFERLNTFLNRLEQGHIYYKLDKICPDTILVEVAVPGERWEVEFAADGEIVIEKFKSIGMFEEDELEVLLADYSD